MHLIPPLFGSVPQYTSYYSLESELFFWFVAMPLTLGIPYLYVMYVAADVYFKGLLPPRGYRRELAIYYFKIIFVVLFIWMPYLVFFVALRGIVHPWTVWSAGSLAHSQTLVSAFLACQKQDIRAAVLEFWCCTKTDDAPKKKSERKGHMAASVCHGSFPQQRDDYGFEGETDSSRMVPSIIDAPIEEAAEQEEDRAEPSEKEGGDFVSEELRIRLEKHVTKGQSA